MKEVSYPPGTLYTQFGQLCIKGRPLASGDDFFYDGISPIKVSEDDFGMGASRWGEFDTAETFIVYEIADILVLTARLTEISRCYAQVLK